MNATRTSIAGCVLIDVETIPDRRGFFARLYSRDEFQSLGVDKDIIQTNWSMNDRRGTLRGMHYQIEPFEEIKIVQCLRGSLHDVVLDVRRDSPTFGRWEHFTLNPDTPQMLVVPRGCAHGFQSLEDRTELLYHVTAAYSPAHARGVRWNDPQFNIDWPLEVSALSERDQAFPDFKI
jgi:dTDP-4-dehydrorhamnose 3,5-epimerase